MKIILQNLRNNWIKYGFETLAITVGILGAFALDNWNENRKQQLNDIEFLKNLKSEIVLDTVSLSNRIIQYYSINSQIANAVNLIDTSTVLTANQYKIISETIEKIEVLLPTYKNLDRNGMMLSSGAINRQNPDLHKNYLDYLDSFKFSYDLSNKLTMSLNDALHNELYPHVDLNFTDPLKNHVVFNLNSLKNNHSFINALQKSIWYRQAVLNTLEPQLDEAKSLIQQIDNQLNNESKLQKAK
jgi:hypothetical protein